MYWNITKYTKNTPQQILLVQRQYWNGKVVVCQHTGEMEKILATQRCAIYRHIWIHKQKNAVQQFVHYICLCS